MKKWIFPLLILFISFLQATFLNIFRVFGVKPDFSIIIVFIASLYYKKKTALFYSLLAGVLKDIFSANSFAVNTLLYPLLSWLIKYIARKITLDSEYICSAFLFFLILASDLFSNILFKAYSPNISLPIFLRVFFLEAIYSVAVFFFLYKHIIRITK